MLNSETSLTLSVPLRNYPLPGTCFYTAQLPPSAFQTSTKPRCLDGSNMVSYSMYLKPSIVPPNEPPKNPKTATARGSSLCLRLSAARLFCSAMGSPPQSPEQGSLCVHFTLEKPSTQLHPRRESKRLTGRLRDGRALCQQQRCHGLSTIKGRHCRFQVLMQSRAELMKPIWSHSKNQTPCSLSTHASGWRPLPILQNWD